VCASRVPPTNVIPAPRAPVRALAGTGRDPCTSKQISPVVFVPGSRGAVVPTVRSESKLPGAWVPALYGMTSAEGTRDCTLRLFDPQAPSSADAIQVKWKML
jgi:hypothetical protein